MATRNKIAPLPYSLARRGMHDDIEYIIEDSNGGNIAQITDMDNNYEGIPPDEDDVEAQDNRLHRQNMANGMADDDVPDTKATAKYFIKALNNYHPLLGALIMLVSTLNEQLTEDAKENDSILTAIKIAKRAIKNTKRK